MGNGVENTEFLVEHLLDFKVRITIYAILDNAAIDRIRRHCFVVYAVKVFEKIVGIAQEAAAAI